MKKEITINGGEPIIIIGPISKLEFPKGLKKNKDYIAIDNNRIKMTFKTFSLMCVDLSLFRLVLPIRTYHTVHMGLMEET